MSTHEVIAAEVSLVSVSDNEILPISIHLRRIPLGLWRQ
ncbi:hypothetical protein BTN49_1169 [Candidatus Enterovibrio escicola]|uniref:Mobile element protein n=1 Tax=Candidatus Enterovibrio escicola TaxID=1927127 RepID=A0A2A5T4U7_9GAMM|nr:hypothetical protein BTN49_1169 [Candidatus Enterovibrio escacola]